MLRFKDRAFFLEVVAQYGWTCQFADASLTSRIRGCPWSRSAVSQSFVLAFVLEASPS